ncbi:hypothetical protein DL93DRAFT_2228541 [Clavulina sp. PMI_390]|nr:hypothetical protein DL93DRAFT_2228541 [Clavulina sp. PMI_390]
MSESFGSSENEEMMQDLTSDDAAVETPYNFDTEGAWDETRSEGAAVHIPDECRGARIESFRIEWLDVSNVEHNDFPKNHIVGVVEFADVLTVDNRDFQSARISMEVLMGVSSQQPKFVGEDLESGEHYWPRVFFVKLQPFLGPSNRTLHHVHYPVNHSNPPTVGDLIDAVVGTAWKGCGDFVLQFWHMLFRRGFLTSDSSIEDEDNSKMLQSELAVTYYPDGTTEFVPVGKGHWVGNFQPYMDDDQMSGAYLEGGNPISHVQKAAEAAAKSKGLHNA